MDDEETPWRTPTRKSGVERPRGADASDANVDAAMADSGSATTTPPAASSGSSSNQKRKRHAKKRRRTSASARGEAMQESGKADRDAAADGKVSTRGDKNASSTSAAPSEWSCPACTYLNDAARRFCEMCGTGNPTKPTAEKAPSEWSCVACTMKNAPALRTCAVCGTINPNPSVPAALSIARRTLHGGLFLGGAGGVYGDEGEGEDDDDDDEDDDDDDDSDGSSGSDSGSSSGSGSDGGTDADRRLECPCLECGVTIGAGQSSCPECHAPHPLPRRKLKRSDLSSRLHKLTRKISKHDKSATKKKKSKDSQTKKNAYGVSSEVLRKLLIEPKSSKLVDTLQALTHTLAMMDASADSEWGDMHGGGGVNAFFVHGFGGNAARSDEGKDTALLDVLASILREEDGRFPAEVRLFAVQSINYILKMDRHLFKKEDVVEVVRIYLHGLKTWTTAAQSEQQTHKDEQMAVEECVNGLCGLGGSESAMLRELIKPAAFGDFLDFLTHLATHTGNTLHSSVITNSLELLQKCCAKIKWDRRGMASSVVTPDAKDDQLKLAKRIVDLLRSLLKHGQPALHVSASKCLLLLFRRSPRVDQKQQSFFATLITSEVILDLVAVLTSKNIDEPSDSRQAAASLLMHLLESRREMMEIFVHDRIYEPLLDGIERLMAQPNSNAALTSHSLKLVSLLLRRVHRKPTRKHLSEKPRSTTPVGTCNRIRLDSCSDPDVLAILLLDFIRADSIPAVSALLKDGADLNGPSVYDSKGHESEKPLVVAAEVASLAMVRFLVKRGVDIHQVGPSGTALHVAALTGRCDVVSFLLECGASPTDVDQEGVSVLKRLGDFESSEEETGAKTKSPVRKLLELHQRALGQGGEDSDNSEDKATIRRFDSRRWLFSGEREGDEEDEEDEFDEDDYMEYDGSEDDSDEDEDMSSDEETVREEADAHGKPGQRELTVENTKKEKKRRRESVSSEKNEGKRAAKRSRRNSESAESPDKLATIERRRRGSSEVADDDVLVLASPSQIECFRSTVMSSLLKMLRVVDHKNVNRGVLSTLASALEMAPSTLVQTIADTDISLLLETVIHLLQDPIMSTRATHTHEAEAQMSRTLPQVEVDSKTSSSSAQASQKVVLTSYILALRILQAVVRKSKRESSVFYEIERRGICEQIERLHAHSLQASQLPQLEGDNDQNCVNDRAGIFWRGMQLLEFLRSNMVESGMLHLHRLRNMTRRLKELSEDSPIQERDMVLVDLVELFEEENSITSHEFKQSNLLEAIQSFLLPTGHDAPIPKRVELLLDRFAGSPAAFTSLITRLQSVVNQEENLPLLSFFTGKGRELYPLTKQLKIVCTRAQHASTDEPKLQKMLQLSALTHFQSFEKTIFRCMPVKDATLSAFYFSLIGHYVHKAVDGKWKKFWVCGFDQSRSMHLLKPVDDPASDEAAEIVLHDTQFKLSIAMDVYAEPTVDFSLFGDPHPDSSSDSASNGDDKKRKRQSKKRRKSSVSGSSGAGTAVEVQNVPSTNAGKLRGAWYAGEIVFDGSNGTAEGSDGVVASIEAGKAYNVRLLSSGATLKNVQGDKIRLRHDVAQVGSVVEVDGLLGEVTRAETSQGSGDHDIFDVKISRDRERKGITKARIRYPPSANTPSPASSSGIIEAMSLSRLFPPRESSVVAGTIGDKVWVSPKNGADGANVPVGDFYLAGTIHSFPAGSDSIGPSASVFVEVSFGPKSSIIKVEQSRVTNLSNGRSSRLGSSRLLSALSMSGDRSGGNSVSGPTLHRLLQSTASNELFSNRRIPGSSESAIDHLRQLLAQSSSSRDSALSHLLNAPSTDSISAIGSTSTDEVEPKPTKRRDDDAQTRLGRVWKLLTRGEKKLFSKCIRPPKMSVVIGYERTENLDIAGNDRGYEDEYGSSSSLFAVRRSSDALIGEASLTEIDSQTGKAVFKTAVASALSEVFVNFDGSEADSRSLSKSAKKARRKQKMVMHDAQSAACTDPNHMWDIDTFSAFMAAALGVSALDDPEGTLVDNCIKFSLFAAPATGRRRLDLSGFLACVADACKSTRNARHLLRFLVSRGHDPSSLTGEDPKRPTRLPAASPSTSIPAQRTEVEMKSFPSDQNMLKCLNELQRGNDSTDSTPPWKLKYFVRCDVVIDWSKVVKRDPDTSTHSMQEEGSRVPHQLATIDGVLSDSLMAKAVHVLSCLHNSLPRSLKISDDVWRNPRLTSKLESQLEDVISVCSGIYPEWCDAVVSECKFFFPRELREKLFHATSFGCTRSLHWFRSQLNVDDAGGSASGNAAADSLANGPGIAGDGIYNHEITISPIPKERVKVNRENLLQSADAIMKMHAKRKAILDIVFVGEKGYGSGVTAAFYSATAQALQSTEENAKENSRCWVPGIENDREDTTIRHPNGLFPFPHAGTSAPTKVVERFRMMGRLAGKALMDNRLFPLPLSPQFIKLVLGQSITTDELERVFLSPGKVVKDMKRAVDQVEAAVDTACIQVDGMPLVQWLNAVGFTFIDPLSQKELEPKGATKDVTLENLGEYVQKVISLWLHDGIHAQVQAFRQGISDVLPVEKLNLLFVHELLSLLCGDADIAWDVASLTSTMKLAHGYTKDSVPVQYFVDVLAEMTVPQRREFLLYATGCPNLPGGGFAALRPPFEVVRRVVDTDNVDQALPFARTCTNTLHLPAYSSKKVLEERLRYAIANSAGVIDRD